MSDYEWRRSSFCASGACVLVAGEFGGVVVSDSKLGDASSFRGFTSGGWARVLEDIRNGFLPDGVTRPTYGTVAWGVLRFTNDEWDAFVAGVHNGEFDYDKLSSGDEAGSGFRGVARSGQAATGAGAIAVPPAPVAANPCTCPPPTAGGIVDVNRGHLLGCPELAGDVAAPVAADPTIGEALCADGIHEADGPCCSTGAAALVPGSSRRAPEADDRDPELADALHAATSLPRSELLPEVRRLVNAQGWDPSSPQWAVIRAAIAWRNTVANSGEHATEDADALMEAVDALADAGESQASEPARPAPVAAQPRYILDKDAILELVIRYAVARIAADRAYFRTETERRAATATADDLLEAIRGALTPVPDVEPEPAWGSGPLVEHVTETPAEPTPPAPSYPAGICRCGADGHGPGDNLCVCLSAS